MGVTGVRVVFKDASTRQIDVPGVFVFIGNNVNNQVLIQEDGSFLCDMNSAGEVIVDISMNTSVAGLYATGDMRICRTKASGECCW